MTATGLPADRVMHMKFGQEMNQTMHYHEKTDCRQLPVVSPMVTQLP